MRPACVKCGLQMKPERIGLPLILTTDPEKEHDYQLWMSDLWRCPGCDVEILCGYGCSAVAESFQDDFEDKCKSVGADLRVF